MTRYLFALLYLLFVATSCTNLPEDTTTASLTLFQDAREDRSHLIQAVENSLAYLQKKNQDSDFTVNGEKIPLSRLSASLLFFQQLLADDPSPATLHYLVSKHFTWHQITGPEKTSTAKMLVTGYYQPVFQGSLTRRPPYIHPVYSVPGDLQVRTEGGKQVAGRMEKNNFIPYWSRQQIEEGNKAAGHELVYLRDPTDVFFLHIQGSGIIQLENGMLKPLRFARKNGRPYRSIGKLLVDTGRVRLQDTSMDSIRDYIARHPEQREEIFYHNESYIFFSWGDSLDAVGSLGLPLTPGHSVAADPHFFPPGALAFLSTRQPHIEPGREITWRPLQRFVCIQDEGSAIQGPQRVDIFWGRGDAAGTAAGLMREKGQLHLLLLKKEHPALAMESAHAPNS